LEAIFDGARLKTALHFEQTDGLIDGRAEIGMSWGNDVLPRLERAEPASAVLEAHRFRLAALMPFVKGSFSGLDGRIDADARIDLGPGPVAMAGHVTLAEGRFQLTRLGEPFERVTAKILFAPNGVVRLDEATAYGPTGKVMANGIATLKGLQLVSARAAVRIPKDNPLPVDFDGVDIGDIDGDVKISVDSTANQRETNVKLDVPHLHALLPPSSTHDVQELEETKEIRIGFYQRPKTFVRLPRDADDFEPKAVSDAAPSSVTVAIHLGDDIEIRKGTMLRVALAGDPVIHMTDKTRMSGQIWLQHGTLEVQGKRFEIEKGTVTFVGDDPANPQVVVTAGWTAPDGTRVYADFVGPLKTGKVILRSQPSRPQNEILALIMFGTAQGSSSTPYSAPKETNSTTQAGVVAGGFATDGLSKGLDQLTGLAVNTKIDTSTSNPRPEIELQVARDISLQIGYIIGTPPLGTNPDKTLLTVDWRFMRKWSLEATFGNAGSSILDMVWQHRY
jgi:translocation and assembly module TamB